ncbi:aminotransferase [Leisingera daeponensis]|nr:aminotransferase [Leisingera daeponensis]
MDRAHFLHPFTLFDSFAEEGSLIMDKADGRHVYDADGKCYLDGIGGLWCVNVGYGRDEIVDAMAEQARKMAYANPFTDMGNAPAARLAAKIAELAPGNLNHVMFSSGGSTAGDSAFRLIGYYWGCKGNTQRRLFLSRRGAYHGSTYITQSLTGNAGREVKEFTYADDIVRYVAEPNLSNRPESMSEEEYIDWLIQEFEERVQEIGPDNIAAHFAEPVMGAGGVIVPPQRYITATREICAKHGILYVADEVVTAFGRLGAWFASKDVFGIQPDMIVSAKGLSSGYLPLGATIFSDEMHGVIAETGHGRLFSNGFTYSGHPVCCAAALKNIEIMERENLPGYVKNDIGPYFMEKLGELSGINTVGEIRGSHLMACIVNVADSETGKLFDPAINIGKRIAKAAQKRGLIVRPLGNLNILSPSLTITREETDQMVSILSDAMAEVHADLNC